VTKVKLSLDTSEAESVFSRLAEFAEFAPELVQCLVDTPHLFSKLFRIIVGEDAATGTSDIRARLKPTDFLLKFMAALEAFQGERGVT